MERIDYEAVYQISTDFSQAEVRKIMPMLVPVEPDYEAAWKAWKATGNIEDAVDAALGIGGDDE